MKFLVKLVFCRLIRFFLYFIFCIVSLFFISCNSSILKNSDYAKIYFFWYPPTSSVTGYEVSNLASYSSLDDNTGLFYKIEQTSINKNGNLQAPSSVIIDDKPVMVEQCGTYNFTISLNGDVIHINDFEYSGEKNIQVARGIGWSMYITRENWKNK